MTREVNWSFVVEMNDGNRVRVPSSDAKALLDNMAAAIAEHYLSTTTEQLIEDALNGNDDDPPAHKHDTRFP